MEFQSFQDMKLFTALIYPYLQKAEAENNLFIGICQNVLRYNLDARNYFMATVTDDIGPLVIALQTPPFNLILYEVRESDEALQLLAQNLVNDIPGVGAVKHTALRFSSIYSCLTGKSVIPGLMMRIYRLDEVKYKGKGNGKLRQAAESDLTYLPYWELSFKEEAHVEANELLEEVYEKQKERYIRLGILYVYETQHPVSMAAVGRETFTGAVINSVYTPPYYRNNGYATELTAKLCQKLLDDGFKFCALFTDLSNPVSNKIYQRIGFYPVTDYDSYLFK